MMWPEFRKQTAVAKWLRSYVRTVIYAAAGLALTNCAKPGNAVSGTIEVDEVHVGPRSPGRVEKIFAQEGDRLEMNQPIVQLEASEMRARRDLAAAQIE